ncbi:UNVERIFIED_CONTAM: hypothetical protein GTU68_033694 [Idotea baltica]|nr:hypothetical protein [Idotea baltica]
MLGGGQLGRYALMAAASMGYRTIVLDPDPSAPAAVHANQHIVAAYDDADALERLSSECDVITTEFENPPAEALAALAAATSVAPRSESVAIAQDRIKEKSFLVDNGFPVGPFVAIDGSDPQWATVSSTGGGVVKTARLGYDGKGQRRVGDLTELHAAVADLGVRCVAESLLDLRCELSVLVARTADARVETWPVAENMHVDGILDVSVVPARVAPTLADRATALATSIAEAMNYVGVLAVEMFIVSDANGEDKILVNELAPRPHNSGHWTLDASVTSQFEQQIRAVCGAGLADTSMTAPAVAMVNLLGEPTEPLWASVLANPAATLHLYGKSEPRPGRKMGHVTVTGSTPDLAESKARQLRADLVDH